MDWSTLLFVFKWIFLGLIYIFIVLVLINVFRELKMRIPVEKGQAQVISCGRLRVIQQGSDPDLSQGAIINLQPDTRIGSQPGNTITLRDTFISAQHARMHWDGFSWWVEDLNSTNGTFINKQRLQHGVSILLPYGGILKMGEMTFELLE
jgi:hypothetical protein